MHLGRQLLKQLWPPNSSTFAALRGDLVKMPSHVFLPHRPLPFSELLAPCCSAMISGGKLPSQITISSVDALSPHGEVRRCDCFSRSLWSEWSVTPRIYLHNSCDNARRRYLPCLQTFSACPPFNETNLFLRRLQTVAIHPCASFPRQPTAFLGERWPDFMCFLPKIDGNT